MTAASSRRPAESSTFRRLRETAETATLERIVCLDKGFRHVPLPREIADLRTFRHGHEPPAERLLDMIVPEHHARVAKALEEASEHGVSGCQLTRSDSAAIGPGESVELRLFDMRDEFGLVIALTGTFADAVPELAVSAAPEPPPRTFTQICDSAGRYLLVDSNTTPILGWTPEELEGLSGTDLLHPEDRAMTISAWVRALAGNATVPKPVRFRTKEGGWRWLEITYVFRPDESGGTMRSEALDVHGEIEAISRAETIAARYESLSRALPVGVIELDGAGAITFANRWVEEKTGIRVDDIDRSDLGELVHPDDRDSVGPWLEAALAGRAEDFEVRMRHARHNRYRTYLVSTVPVDRGDMAAGVICSLQDVTDSIALQKQLRLEASIDHLTGLLNRTELRRRLADLMHPVTGGKPFACLFFDLDSFQLVNDGMGHDVGDQLLVAVGARLQSHLGENDIVARVGGDEFVAVCADHDSEAESITIVEHVMHSLRAPLSIGGLPVTVSMSAGVAFHDGSEVPPDVILGNADLAMNEAKRNGGARLAVYRDELRSSMEQRFDLHRSLQTAIHNNEFRMHLQPVFNMVTDEVIGAEALIRWYHPTRGHISPGYFIDYVADSDLMVPLGWWIINDSCRIAARIVEHSEPTFRLAVNVTGRQLTEPGFADKLFQTIEYHGLKPRNLALEITETVLISDGPLVRSTLQAISDGGCVISLDDFGTGYSSLNHIRDIPVDALKIDQTYSQKVDIDPTTHMILVAVRDLANGLGLRVVVEGVETLEQRQGLLALGFKIGQGYLMARPCDEEVFMERYAPKVLKHRSDVDLWSYAQLTSRSDPVTA